MSKTPLEVVREFVLRFQTEGADGVSGLMADDIVLHEPESLPYGGDHVGKEAFFKFSQEFNKLWRFERHGDQDHTYIDAGNGLVAFLASVPVTALRTGMKFDLKAAEFMTVVDEKITDIRVFYWDTKLLVDATTG